MKLTKGQETVSITVVWFVLQALLASLFEVAIAVFSPMDAAVFGLCLVAYGAISVFIWGLSMRLYRRKLQPKITGEDSIR